MSWCAYDDLCMTLWLLFVMCQGDDIKIWIHLKSASSSRDCVDPDENYTVAVSVVNELGVHITCRMEAMPLWLKYA